jgi:hypothetical protein
MNFLRILHSIGKRDGEKKGMKKIFQNLLIGQT